MCNCGHQSIVKLLLLVMMTFKSEHDNEQWFTQLAFARIVEAKGFGRMCLTLPHAVLEQEMTPAAKLHDMANLQAWIIRIIQNVQVFSCACIVRITVPGVHVCECEYLSVYDYYCASGHNMNYNECHT